jgi:hypothetical protein
MSIDLEWEKFISNTNDDTSTDDELPVIENNINANDEEIVSADISMDLNSTAPKANNIYVSTKTKIAYLNTTIDLKKVFWCIPVIPYYTPCNGVVKKQMKFNSIEKEELDFLQNKIKNEPYFEENVITHIDNPDGRIKFKDIRKISIGISKKDILSYRSKKKSAFYNCFVIILRMKINDIFKEFHIKIFNTGKLEIPGIQNETIFLKILEEIIETIRPYTTSELGYKADTNETVLINSNFNCGYYINREVLHDVLKFKYNIQSIYDPCSYPGIQCKFYYNPEVDVEKQTGSQISNEDKDKYKQIVEVSFMIFRTGSILIVGMCNENVLYIIYEFIKKMLVNEFHNVSQEIVVSSDLAKNKNKKIRKKQIFISV